MIVDTSIIIAILQDEADSTAIAAALHGASVRRLSAANYLEAGVVTDGNRNAILSRRLDELIRDAEIAIEPVTANQARIARGSPAGMQDRSPPGPKLAHTAHKAARQRRPSVCPGKVLSRPGPAD